MKPLLFFTPSNFLQNHNINLRLKILLMAIRKITTAFLLCLFSLCVSAQQTTTNVLGAIVDKVSKAPVEFANVELLTTDSAVIKGTVTDAKGRFNIDQVKAGSYLLRYSFIGYQKMVVAFTADKPRVNLGTLEIMLVVSPVNNVTVTSTKSLLNTSIDRKSYDVTKDIMAQSGTASDRPFWADRRSCRD